MALSAAALAEIVQKEIEKQQAAVCYDDLSEEELNKVIAQLNSKLELCQAALSARSGKPEVKALKAKKVEATFPELPWGRK